MSKPRVALIGLGLMGSGMARRLLGAGFPLTVYNRSPERAAPLEAEGARVAASPREAASAADVIFSMVADDAASRSIWLGKDGALAEPRPRPGARCSTRRLREARATPPRASCSSWSAAPRTRWRSRGRPWPR